MRTARFVIGCSLLAVVACGDEPATGLDLTLVPDPNVNVPGEVARMVDSLVLVLDGPGGLYHPGDDDPRDDSLQLEDADGDPSDLELVATVPIEDDTLPWIRIARGGLAADTVLDLRVLGLPASGREPVALGGAEGIALDAGEVALPFNLVPKLLPPRIAEVVPGDGDVALGCLVDRVVIIFSKPIDPATFLAPGTVLFEPGGAPTSLRVDASGRFGEVTPPALPGDESVRYHLTITTAIRDEDGRPLDQVPAEEGAQPFEHDFDLPCEPGPQIPDPNCGDPEPAPRYWCGIGGRFECIDGMCIPTDCDDADCEAPTVCDPATASCEVDCRLYGPQGACPDERPSCDAATGACVPAPRG